MISSPPSLTGSPGSTCASPRPTERSLQDIANGTSIREITEELIAALDPDHQYAVAEAGTEHGEPSAAELEKAAADLMEAAVYPLASNPELRIKIVDFRRSYEQIIDETSLDKLLKAGYSTERAATDHRRLPAVHRGQQG